LRLLRPSLTLVRLAARRFVCVSMLLLCASACADAGLDPAVELPQADGSVLRLPHPVRTLITLSPHLTELAFAAGAGDRILATVEFSEYPAAASALPRIGDAFRLDLERILTLKPDLIVAWQSGNPRAAVASLESLGLRVWTVEIRKPDEIATTLEWFGRAVGTSAQADATALAIREALRDLEHEYAGLEPVSYFYQVAAHPLYTINGEHLISQALALCGGANVFDATPGLAPQVSHEAVLAGDPQALLAPVIDGEDDPLANWHQWTGLRAVQSNALFLLPADEISRATPRMLDAVGTACRLLHPLRGNPDQR